MNVTLTFKDGRVETVPVQTDTTVTFTWQTRSADGYRTIGNEQAFALADVAAMSVGEETLEASAAEVAETAAPVADEPPAGEASPRKKTAARKPRTANPAGK